MGFDSFESLNIDEVGYGAEGRLIPPGKLDGEDTSSSSRTNSRSFLDDVKARNYSGVNGATLSEMKQDDLKVPAGVGGTVTEDNPNGIQWVL